ncbi:MAG: universal stress protein [Nocardioides sp.]|uniref:universal stress protein n=1 Tax=Nocardioides sp. TaxID=35761 RepID=UPI0032668011
MDEITRNSIVVGYDGSPEADLALAWAAETSSLSHRTVQALMVDDRYAGQWSGPRDRTDDELTAYVEDILKRAGAQGSLERRTGTIVPELLEAAQQASMLVVGSHGHGRIAEVLIGSVSQHVATHAAGPVVVVREPAQPSAARIVVGIDGSGGSEAALEFACRRAELTGEIVVAVHAWNVGRVLLDRRGELSPDLGPTIVDRELLLSESVAGVRDEHPDVILQLEAIPVAPGQALVDESATASLIVTGSHGRGAFTGMLLGSVSHEVLCRAECPVAIVR